MDNQLGEIIKELRTELNMNRPQFCEQSGISLSSIEKIEGGKRFPNDESMNKLLQFFANTQASFGKLVHFLGTKAAQDPEFLSKYPQTLSGSWFSIGISGSVTQGKIDPEPVQEPLMPAAELQALVLELQSGFLDLTSWIENEDELKPLPAQFKALAERVKSMDDFLVPVASDADQMRQNTGRLVLRLQEIENPDSKTSKIWKELRHLRESCNFLIQKFNTQPQAYPSAEEPRKVVSGLHSRSIIYGKEMERV